MNVITVAAAIILNEQNQLLVVRKKNTACFMQVGGKLDGNETAEQAMLREISEEIGGIAQIKCFVGRYETRAANEPDHLLVSYLYFIHFNQTPQIQAEIAEMKWIDLSDDHTCLAPLTQDIVIPWVKQHLKENVDAC
ncbi:DNA mismatch repair protein MutT [Acinetobacter sp. ANC 4558]|uniref:NUDIX hydrolase n=1 Tax=Acinetobacter sp. ANC 4558 TaxID=1977876 RepID=UPI000A330B60|nr:NUDIX domain-containing protein [Acinetobacter sp. ANC 4558]OTG87997.1 DNA mismatch repair protein MutT [Acinetobacter sp. ANC 4558]